MTGDDEWSLYQLIDCFLHFFSHFIFDHATDTTCIPSSASLLEPIERKFSSSNSGTGTFHAFATAVWCSVVSVNTSIVEMWCSLVGRRWLKNRRSVFVFNRWGDIKGRCINATSMRIDEIVFPYIMVRRWMHVHRFICCSIFHRVGERVKRRLIHSLEPGQFSCAFVSLRRKVNFTYTHANSLDRRLKPINQWSLIAADTWAKQRNEEERTRTLITTSAMRDVVRVCFSWVVQTKLF